MKRNKSYQRNGAGFGTSIERVIRGAKTKARSVLLCVMMLMLCPALASSFVITGFGPETYNPDTTALDTVLGISGCVVEDFEDSVLLPGLQISTDTQPVPLSTVEIVTHTAGSRPWDGSYSIHNVTLLPDPVGPDDQKAMSITIHVDGGATSLGFGLSDLQSCHSPTHSILVNGSTVVSDLFSALPMLYDYPCTPTGAYERTGYILIDAEAGEVIETVTFRIDAAPQGTIDGICIDHVAFLEHIPGPAPHSLVAYYPLDGNASDESGNNYHGVEHNGVQYVDGLIGQAASFDGIDDFISMGNVLNFERTESYSIFAWVNTTSTRSGCRVVSKQSNVAPLKSGPYTLHTHADGRIGNELVHDSRYSALSATTDPAYQIVNDGRWHLIGFTYDGSSSLSGLKLYIDGQIPPLGNSYTALTGSVLTSTDFQISGRDGANYVWDGLIDEVRVYNYVLSNAAIQSLFTTGYQTPQEKLAELETSILSLPENMFTNNANKRKAAMSAKISDLIHTLDLADVEFDDVIRDELHQEVIDKLNHDIRAKADGCLGANERNDWITDCNAQVEINVKIDYILSYYE